MSYPLRRVANNFGDRYKTLGGSGSGGNKTFLNKCSDYCCDNQSHVLIVSLIVLLLVIFVVMFKFYDPFTNYVKDKLGYNMNFSPKPQQNTQNQQSDVPSHDVIRSLQVLYFMRPTCPHCQNMNGILSGEGTLGDFQVIDISTDEGAKLSQQFNIEKYGVPNFVSLKLKTGLVGVRPNTKAILDELIKQAQQIAPTQQPNNENTLQPSDPITPNSFTPEEKEYLKSFNIFVFKSDSCGHCRRAMNDILGNDLTNYINVIDLNTPESQEIMKNLGVNSSGGIPIFFSAKTGKLGNGYGGNLKQTFSSIM